MRVPAQDVGLLLAGYEPGAEPGWTYSYPGHHVFRSRMFGTLEVGTVPGRTWDQWVFEEVMGGGVMAAGVTRDPGDLFIVLLKAARFNLMGPDADYEVAGGFQDPGEVAVRGAYRELFEETGMVAELHALPGRLFTGNRSFGVLRGEDAGTKGFYFWLTREHLEYIRTRQNTLMFVHLRDAARMSRDGLSGAIVARVLAELL